MNTNNIFKNVTEFYIMCNISNSNIISHLDERRKLLLHGEMPKNSIMHITLLQFDINQDHYLANKFKNKNFHVNIAKIYNDTVKNKKFILRDLLGRYELLGKGNHKFLTKVYEPYDKFIITQFRKKLYNYISEYIGSYSISINKQHDNMYYVFNVNGTDLFAVPSFYFGIGVWKPHLSIVNTGDIERYNAPLYQKYVNVITMENKLNVIVNEIIEQHFGPMGDIDMCKDINTMTISWKHLKSKSNYKTEINYKML